MRGRDDTGKDLIIAGDYIAHGFRHRAAELATEWLLIRQALFVNLARAEVSKPLDGLKLNGIGTLQ